MFTRDIKIRSNNQIKSSEKKNLIKKILKQYPTINEEELKNLIRDKDSEVVISKIVSYESVDLLVYFIDKIPYLFKLEKDDELIPTVYFLWKFPNILPKFYTHKEVFGKLVNGADLMLPGVIIPGQLNLYTFRHIKKNDLCSICLKGNDVPVAIGRANISGEDMYMSAMRGKCLNLLHVYQDNLWAQGDKSLQLPVILSNFPDQKQLETKLNEVSDEPKREETESVESKTEQENEAEKISYLNLNETDEEENKIDHEQILTDSFLSACKFRSKEIKFPIIVSTFMKTMQTCCPPGTQFDLKQTKFKKISVFLKEMETKGCIRTKELQKGVLSITEINKENDLIKFFKKPDWLKQKDEMESKEEVKSVFEVFEIYKIDGTNEEIFKGQFRRGDILAAAEIRQFIMNYIKENNLQDTENPKFVKLNEMLTKVFVKNKQVEKLKFDELFSIIFSKMNQMHQIKRVYSDKIDRDSDAFIRKGRFQPVEFKLESRGGNKKITNIYNLSAFELDPITLQSILKNKIGCSVSIVEPVGASQATNDFVLTIQGNQIHTVSELLKNEFGIQFKHMQGLEQGIKN